MAIGTIDHSKKEAKNSTFDELANQIKALKEETKKIKASTKELKNDDKNKIRINYLKICQLYRQIIDMLADSQSQKDIELREFAEKDYKFFTEKAKELGSAMSATIPSTTFDDVKGLDEVKAIVKSFIFMAKNPKILDYYHIKGGLGMLMYGAPGTGKTMFAEALANAMQLPLFVVTPADIFKSYVGQSEAAVRQLFDEIDLCPNGAVLFVDECESIFSKRSDKTEDYKAAVTTELLQRINGFGINGAKRIMVAATNRPELIDSAYLRYKRFSHLVHVTPPDDVALMAIIKSKLKGIKCGNGSDEDHERFEKYILNKAWPTVKKGNSVERDLAKGYYSAADICGVIEEACRQALEILERENASEPIPLTLEMFDKAFGHIPPSITPKILDEYNNFRKQD